MLPSIAGVAGLPPTTSGVLPVLSLTYFAGIFIAALASLAVVAYIAVYLIRNNPRAFLKFRKLRPEPEADDETEYEE